MREILFRGKRVSDGQWVTGSYIRANMHWHEKGVHEDWISSMVFANGGYMNVAQKYAVKGDTVGQYTGLTDKNGKKIFEGDIVDIPGSKKLGLPAEIWFNQRTASFEIRRIGYNSLSVDGIEYWGEVVGNIHDNPELLEVVE